MKKIGSLTALFVSQIKLEYKRTSAITWCCYSPIKTEFDTQEHSLHNMHLNATE